MISINKEYEKSNSKNQYEGKENELGYGIVKARYIKQDEITFRGNPLIEALPPVLEGPKLMDKLSIDVHFDIEERNKEYTQRNDAIGRISDSFFPTGKNAHIYNRLSTAIRYGYRTKDLVSIEYYNDLLKHSENRNKISMSSFELIDEGVCQKDGFAIVGMSGVGKTTTIRKCKSLYPRAIFHYGNGKEKSMFIQIPIITLECSINGSIRGMCISFFENVDDILKTDYKERYAQKMDNVDSMVNSMLLVAKTHAIGAIIIDEIQNLNLTKTSELAVKFFQLIANELRVPIIYMGTYETFNGVFSKVYRLMRKAEGSGDVIWEEMKNNDEFRKFVKQFWNYQWTRKHTELNEDILNILHYGSMGNVDRLLKIFMNTQRQAITTGIEKITVPLIGKVLKDEYKLSYGMMKAYHSTDKVETSKYEDLKVPYNLNLNGINQAYEIEKADINEMIENNSQRAKTRVEIESDLVEYGTDMGYDYLQTKKVAEFVIDEFPQNTNIIKLRKEMTIRLLESDSSIEIQVEDGDTTKKKKQKTRIRKSRKSIPENPNNDNVDNGIN